MDLKKKIVLAPGEGKNDLLLKVGRVEKILVAQDLEWARKDSFMTVAFLSLLPIPVLKITDKGLVDAVDFKIIPLYEE